MRCVLHCAQGDEFNDAIFQCLVGHWSARRNDRPTRADVKPPTPSPSVHRVAEMIEETEIHLDNCAALEEEIYLIQQRRQQRQQVLVTLGNKLSFEAAPAHESSVPFVSGAADVPPDQGSRLEGSNARRSTDNPAAKEENPPKTRSSLCPWCHREAPEDHFRKCLDRVLTCTVCAAEVRLRDKRAHREFCFYDPSTKRYPQSTMGCNPPSGAAPINRKPSVTFAT